MIGSGPRTATGSVLNAEGIDNKYNQPYQPCHSSGLISMRFEFYGIAVVLWGGLWDGLGVEIGGKKMTLQRTLVASLRCRANENGDDDDD